MTESKSKEKDVGQHRKPCAECPFRRKSLPGWLGGLTPDEFRWLANSEARMPCHSAAHGKGIGIDYRNPDPALPQCAGRAIYWANQLKRARTDELLTLP